MKREPLPPMRATAAHIEQHLRAFFARHAMTVRHYQIGPMVKHPHFRVLEIAPGPRSGLWTYASVGASALPSPNNIALEFVLCCEQQSMRGIELVAMTAFYHSAEGLGWGHTMPIGEPWLPDSLADHLLVSLPYPFGPKLEIVADARRPTHVLWLLPITKAERDYRVRHDLEALEQVFDRVKLEYWVTSRA